MKKSKHKHIFKFENSYRKFDLYTCKCGKTVKVMIGKVKLPKEFGEMKKK